MYRVFLFVGIIMALLGLVSLGFGISLIVSGSEVSSLENSGGAELVKGNHFDGIAAIVIGFLITVSGALFARWSYNKAG